MASGSCASGKNAFASCTLAKRWMTRRSLPSSFAPYVGVEGPVCLVGRLAAIRLRDVEPQPTGALAPTGAPDSSGPREGCSAGRARECVVAQQARALARDLGVWDFGATERHKATARDDRGTLVCHPLKPQAGLATGDLWNQREPVGRDLGAEAVAKRRVLVRRLQIRQRPCVLFDALNRGPELALIATLDRPGEVRHLVAQQEHVLDRLAGDQLAGYR